MRAAEVAFVGALVYLHPWLMPILQEHDNHGVLPHLLLADIERWAEAQIKNEGATDGQLRRVLAFLETEYAAGHPYVEELISVSFLELLPGSEEALGQAKDMTRVLRVDAIPDHSQVEISDLLPPMGNWRRARHKPAGCVAVATRPPDEGAVRVELWSSLPKERRDDLKQIFEGTIRTKGDLRIGSPLGNTTAVVRVGEAVHRLVILVDEPSYATLVIFAVDLSVRLTDINAKRVS